MSRLLARSTRLLEILGDRAGAGLPLSAIAAAAGLPPATCSRLLKELVNLGWADQDGNRHQYRLGPRPFALAAAQPYRARLVAAWAPAMRHLVARWPGVSASLVVLRPWRRHLLWECGAGREARQPLREEDDLWARASGRLLIAMLPAADRRRWIDRLGLPDPQQWRGMATRSELVDALADVRRQGWAQCSDPRTGLIAAAAPVPDGEGGHAALGIYASAGCWHPAMAAALRSTARALASDAKLSRAAPRRATDRPRP